MGRSVSKKRNVIGFSHKLLLRKTTPCQSESVTEWGKDLDFVHDDEGFYLSLSVGARRRRKRDNGLPLMTEENALKRRERGARARIIDQATPSGAAHHASCCCTTSTSATSHGIFAGKVGFR